MFVAKRSFRNYGEMITPGSTVEPGAVKHFKALLGDNHIVEVNEHNFDKWKEFFLVRYGVEIKLPNQPVVAKGKTPKETTKSNSVKVTTAKTKATVS